MALRFVDVETEVVSVHSRADTGGHLVHQVGLVVGLTDQLVGQILQHVPLVSVDRVLS